jgi:hypothetical protein
MPVVSTVAGVGMRRRVLVMSVCRMRVDDPTTAVAPVALHSKASTYGSGAAGAADRSRRGVPQGSCVTSA